MNCPICNEPVESGALFCGNCGNKLVPRLAPGVTFAEATQQVSQPASINEQVSAYPQRGNNSLLPPAMQPGQIADGQGYGPYIKGPGQAGLPPRQPSGSQEIPMEDRRRSGRTIFLIGTLIFLVVVASGALVALLQNIGKPATTIGVTARATSGVSAGGAGGSAVAAFSDSTLGQGMTDTIKITTNSLAAPAAGMQYNAWIVDTAGERITALGVLQQGQDKNFTLSYTDSQHQNLLSLGNEVRITQEKQGTTGDIGGNIVLSALMPTKAFVHVRHLLVAFGTTPKKVGLLVGTHDQVALLFAQASNLKTANDQKNQTAVQCYAQAIIDIIEGNHGAHARPLDAGCADLNITATGDGFGLLDPNNKNQDGYLALAAAHAGFAAQSSDATDTIKTHAKHVQICIANVQGWVKDIDGDAQAILASGNGGAQVKEIGDRANLALNGVDLDNDEKVDPVPGEGGASTAYAHGQLMALLFMEPAHK